jgi:hypothetical protein
MSSNILHALLKPLASCAFSWLYIYPKSSCRSSPAAQEHVDVCGRSGSADCREFHPLPGSYSGCSVCGCCAAGVSTYCCSVTVPLQEVPAGHVTWQWTWLCSITLHSAEWGYQHQEAAARLCHCPHEIAGWWRRGGRGRRGGPVLWAVSFLV